MNKSIMHEDLHETAVNDTAWKDIPHGKPKSGRLWKEPRHVRLSKVTKTKPLKTSWTKKMQDKAEKKSIKTFEQNLKQDIKKKLEDKRSREELRKQRQLENSRKSEVVQIITNTAKLKRMKKKQLRLVKKQ